MGIKTRIFDRQQAVFHELGNLVDALINTPFGTETGNFHAIRSENAQRLLGLVIGKRGGIGQLGVVKNGTTNDKEYREYRKTHSRHQRTHGPVDAEGFFEQVNNLHGAGLSRTCANSHHGQRRAAQRYREIIGGVTLN